MNKITLDAGEYTFSAASKTVTLLAHTDLLKKEYLLLITNTTTNTIIYNFGCDGFGGTIASPVITLEYDTSVPAAGMADTDNLSIILYQPTGQQLSVDSWPVVIASDQVITIDDTDLAQEVTLDALLTAFNAEDFSTETTLELVRLLLVSLNAVDFASETTLAAIDAVLDNIKLDTANLDVALSTRATEATLLTNNVLLTAIDAVLDNIKLDTANLDVALSTRASEATLEAARVLLVSLDGKDYATQTTLELIRLLLVSLDATDFATETTLSGISTLLTTIDGVLDAIKLDTAKLDVALSTRLSKADFEARINTQGQKTMAGSTPVVLASDQSTLPITVTGVSPATTQWELSAGNTSTTPLGIGATFTGVTGSSVYSDVLVQIEADQPGTIFFDFTNDGVNYTTFPSTGFLHTANIPSFHIAVKGGRQFRLRFENTSGVAQMYFRAYTYYGVFQKANTPLKQTLSDETDAVVTHSVLTGKDNTGSYRNVKATPAGTLEITNIDRQTGSGQIIDLNGAAKFGEAIILVGDVFGNNTPNALQWDEEFIGSGSIVNQPGSLRVETSTTANSEVRFQSTKKARFMLSQFNIFHCGLQLDNLADVDCERRFGVFDPINVNQNGAYFALIGGAWNVGYCKDGVETLVPQASWNGTNKDLFNDSTALSPYEIHYNAGSIFFFQRGNFLHKVGGLPDPYASEYNFKTAVEVINKNGNTANNGIDLYALGVYRLGEERGETISRVFAADTLIKSSAGYIANAYLSRTGSGGGNANLLVYDGIDNTGELMARIDIGADDVKGISIDSTFSTGLYIEITGTGTRNATISYE